MRALQHSRALYAKRLAELRKLLHETTDRLEDSERQIKYIRQLLFERESWVNGKPIDAECEQIEHLPRSVKEAVEIAIERMNGETDVQDIIEQVDRLYPLAKRNTVMVTLHYAVKEGKVLRVGPRLYVRPEPP